MRPPSLSSTTAMTRKKGRCSKQPHCTSNAPWGGDYSTAMVRARSHAESDLAPPPPSRAWMIGAAARTNERQDQIRVLAQPRERPCTVPCPRPSRGIRPLAALSSPVTPHHLPQSRSRVFSHYARKAPETSLRTSCHRGDGDAGAGPFTTHINMRDFCLRLHTASRRLYAER